MILVVVLAAVTALSGGCIVGVCLGVTWERSRRDAGGIAPHEALRSLYGADVRPIPEARGDWWGV